MPVCAVVVMVAVCVYVNIQGIFKNRVSHFRLFVECLLQIVSQVCTTHSLESVELWE